MCIINERSSHLQQRLYYLNILWRPHMRPPSGKKQQIFKRTDLYGFAAVFLNVVDQQVHLEKRAAQVINVTVHVYYCKNCNEHWHMLLKSWYIYKRWNEKKKKVTRQIYGWHQIENHIIGYFTVSEQVKICFLKSERYWKLPEVHCLSCKYH